MNSIRLPVSSASVINQDSPDGLGSNREELSPILPVGILLSDELEICLMHQCGGLERVIGTFARKVPDRQDPEFVIDGREQQIDCATIASTGLGEQFRDMFN